MPREYPVRVGDMVQFWVDPDTPNDGSDDYYSGRQEPWWQNQGQPNPGNSGTSTPSGTGFPPNSDLAGTPFYGQYRTDANGNLIPIGGVSPSASNNGGVVGGYYNPATGQFQNTPVYPGQQPGQVPSPGGNPSNANASNFNWDALWAALTGSNREQFDWAKELALKQLAQDDKQFSQQLYSNLAQGLLNGAVSLRGPENWLDYATYTTGGQNIFERLFGSTAAPAFGAPTGYSAPVTLQSILRDLGLDPNWTPGSTPAASPTAQAIQQATAPVTGGGAVSSKSELGVLKGLVPTGPQQRVLQDGKTINLAKRGWMVDDPGTSETPMVPLPHQIHPAVWDSYPDLVKQMILASAGKGNTPSGAWDAEHFLSQHYAARPKGQAPSRVAFNWGNTQSLF